jgi:acetyltransferase
MALVLAEPGIAGRSMVYGTVHIAADPDNERAEFAILLRSDMSGLGLGPLLMRRIIDYGRQRGLQELFGEVLRENRPMLKVCELFKFVRHTQPDNTGLRGLFPAIEPESLEDGLAETVSWFRATMGDGPS